MSSECHERVVVTCETVSTPSPPSAPPPGGWPGVKIAGWGSYGPHPAVPGAAVHSAAMKFHEGVSGGGGVMAGYHHHNLMDMYPGPAINTMDWKNTSQVRRCQADD